jgi:LysM domain
VFGVHTVFSGDTLSKLSRRYLGDANRYTDIFNANTDQLKDPKCHIDRTEAGDSDALVDSGYCERLAPAVTLRMVFGIVALVDRG